MKFKINSWILITITILFTSCINSKEKVENDVNVTNEVRYNLSSFPQIETPTFKSLNPTSQLVDVSINPVANATHYGYILYIKEGESYNRVKSAVGTVTQTQFDGLIANQTYRMEVVAFHESYKYPTSNPAKKDFIANSGGGITNPTPPPPEPEPTPQLATPTMKSIVPSYNSVQFELNSVSNATQYVVLLQKFNGSDYTDVHTKILSTSKSLFDSLASESDYRLVVYAKADNYLNSNNLIQTFKTGKAPVAPEPETPPLAPNQLATPSFISLNPTSQTVDVSVNPVANATHYGYILYIKEGESYNRVKSAVGTVTQTQFDGLIANQTYRMQVVAFHENYKYPTSHPANKDFIAKVGGGITNPTPPPPEPTPQLATPTIKSIVPTYNSVQVEINAVTYASQYIISLQKLAGTTYTAVSSKTVSTPSASFDSLASESDYRLVVYAKADNYINSNNLIQTFKTGKAPVAPEPETPPLAPNQLATPSFISLNPTSQTVDVSINPVANATHYGYILYIKEGESYNRVKSAVGTVTQTQFDGLIANQTYRMQVVAFHETYKYPTSHPANKDFIAKVDGGYTPGPSPEPTPDPVPPPPAGNEDGTPIENFGAIAFYSGSKFYGKLTITPISANASRITYEGSDSPFTNEYLNKEFVAYRAHMNPNTLPTTRNYFPGILSSRYSKVTRIIDGKNVEVDFAYNGGNPNTPTALKSASGYFFYNNQQAFIDAFSSSNRKETILLQSGKTYVTKGAWEVTPIKELNVKPSSIGVHSAIKISAEDFFTSKSHTSTFVSDYKGYRNFFKLKNNNLSIRFKDVDILPSLYTAKANYAPILGYFFYHNYSTENNCEVVRELSIENSRSLREIDQIKEEKLPVPAGFVSSMPYHSYSVCGGKDNGHDITDYQQFKLINTDWVSSDVFETKNTHYRAGNILIVKGKSESERARIMSDRSNVFDSLAMNVRFEKDASGYYRIVRILNPEISAYMFNNPYWNTIRYGAMKSPLWLEIPEGDIAFGKTFDFDYIENRSTPNPDKDLILDARRFLVSDAIAPAGTKYKAIKAVNNTTLMTHGIALFKGDIIRIDGQDLTVSNVLTGFDFTHQNYKHIVLNGSFNTNVVDFEVIASAGQKLINGSSVTFQYRNTAWGYLGYINQKLNVVFENLILQGHLRATESNIAGGENDLTLFKQAKYLSFKNVDWTDINAFNQLSHSRDLFNRSKITGVPHRAIIDNSRMYWARPNAISNEVEFRNTPRLTYGTEGVGGPRFIGGIYQDGNGFILEHGDFYFEAIDGKDWDLSNIVVDNDKNQDSFTLYVNGYGSVNISGMRRLNNSKTTKYGLQTVKISGYGLLRQPGLFTLYGDGGEAAIGVTGDTNIKPLTSYEVDLRNWTLGSGVFCNGTCFPSSWINDPSFESRININ